MAAARNSVRLARQIGARQFSVSSAVRDELARPPLQLYGIEGRYAHALYSAAFKKKSLEKVEKDVSRMKELLQQDKLLSAFISDPVINKNHKQSVLDKALKEKKFDDLVVNMCSALAENSRLNVTPGILDAFSKLMRSHRGEVDCTITTAKAVEPGQLKDLTSALGGFVKKNETLKIETKTDASLIGGMVVDIGEYHIDMSIASKIKKITNKLHDAL